MPLDIVIRTLPVLLLQLCTCYSVVRVYYVFFRTYYIYVYVDFVKIIGRT